MLALAAVMKCARVTVGLVKFSVRAVVRNVSAWAAATVRFLKLAFGWLTSDSWVLLRLSLGTLWG